MTDPSKPISEMTVGEFFTSLGSMTFGEIWEFLTTTTPGCVILILIIALIIKILE